MRDDQLMALASRKEAEERQKQLQDHLLKQRLNALKWLLEQPNGKVLWCWLLELTRYHTSNSTGNSREYNYNGRRDVMIDLNAFADMLGIEGLKLRQAAELDYALRIEEIRARLDMPASEHAIEKSVVVKPL